jgi:hypothetical protein
MKERITLERKNRQVLLAAATIVIVGNAAAFIGHLYVVSKIPPGLPSAQILAVAFAVNLTAVAGWILLWLRNYRLGAVLILFPMATMLAIGIYQHLLSSGSNGIFSLPASEWARPFGITAILLLLLASILHRVDVESALPLDCVAG